MVGSSPGGEADFCSPLTGVFAGCGLFFFLSRVTLATFRDLRKRFSLRQNSVKTPSRLRRIVEGQKGGISLTVPSLQCRILWHILSLDGKGNHPWKRPRNRKESPKMSYSIANPTSTNFTEMAADVIVNDVFTYRLISLAKDGIHTLTLRSLEDRSIVARTTSEKGEIYSNDFIQAWVGQVVKENA